jgi:hypothetical protein
VFRRRASGRSARGQLHEVRVRRLVDRGHGVRAADFCFGKPRPGARAQGGVITPADRTDALGLEVFEQWRQ